MIRNGIDEATEGVVEVVNELISASTDDKGQVNGEFTQVSPKWISGGRGTS